MDCPYCGSATKVMDSRAESNKVVRRRKCLDCEKIFFTSEVETDTSAEEFRKLTNEVYRRKCQRQYLKGGV